MRELTILVVCRANYCRSPLVEHLLRASVTRQKLPWTVSSAGTHAQPGKPCHPYTSRVLIERGIDSSGFATRLLAAEQIEAADLVLTAGPEERQRVVALSTAAISRTFPLLAFASWLQNDPEQATDGDIVASALRGRWQTQPLPVAAETLRDPLGRRLGRFRRCAQQIDEAVAAMVSRGGSEQGAAVLPATDQVP